MRRKWTSAVRDVGCAVSSGMASCTPRARSQRRATAAGVRCGRGRAPPWRSECATAGRVVWRGKLAGEQRGHCGDLLAGSVGDAGGSGGRTRVQTRSRCYWRDSMSADAGGHCPLSPEHLVATAGLRSPGGRVGASVGSCRAAWPSGPLPLPPEPLAPEARLPGPAVASRHP